jgi:hypothetical protein
MRVIGQVRLFIHAPGVLGDSQQAACESGKRCIIRISALRQPGIAQAAKLAELGYLQRIGADAMNPGIAKFVFNNRELITDTQQCRSKGFHRRSGDFIVGKLLAQAGVLFYNLLSRLWAVVIAGILTVPPLPQTFLCDPTSEHFICVSSHFSLVDRKLHDLNRVWYAPIHYHEVPKWIASDYNRVDAVAFQVRPMDKNGYFNFGPQTSHAMDIVKACHRHGGPVIVEVNQKMPRCLGGFFEAVHISEVDFIVEGSNPDLFDMPPIMPSTEDQQIANLIMGEMRDGDCIQLGIGGAPTAIGSLIAQSDLKDLGVQTEMLVDACIDMYENGRISNLKKVHT